jgi:hypothetical protein
MTTPLVEVLDLTYAMLAAAKACDWSEFKHLHEYRARLLGPELYSDPDAPWRLPQLFAAQTELAAIRRDDVAAVDEAAKLLGPIGDALVEMPATPRNRWRMTDSVP